LSFNDELRARGVVAFESAGRGYSRWSMKNRRKCPKLIFCDGPGAQDLQAVFQHMDNGGFDPVGARAAIENQCDAALEFAHHMGRAGWADAPKTVGTRSGEWLPKFLHNFLKNRVRAHADRHRVLTSRDNIWNGCLPWKHDCEWSGPKGFSKGEGQRGGEGYA
jgi:hypothetical protein